MDQAVAVGWYDIALRDDIRRQRACARRCRPKNEPGNHIATKPIAVLAGKGKDAVKIAAGLLDGRLKFTETGIETRGRGHASRCAGGPYDVRLGRRYHHLFVGLGRNIDIAHSQAAGRAVDFSRIRYRYDAYKIAGSGPHEVFGAAISGFEGLMRSRNAGLHEHERVAAQEEPGNIALPEPCLELRF